MLCAHAMPCPNDAPLEQRERGFHGIGVNVAIDIDASFVANRFVPLFHSVLLNRSGVSGVFICDNNFYIGRDVIADVLRQCSGLGILSMEKAQFATALTDADNDLLSAESESSLVLVSTLLAANVGFVDFYSAAKKLRRRNGSHCRADAVTQVPRGFIADSHHPLNLIRAHTLARFAEHVSDSEPLVQRQVRVMED